ncbi:hypothetical protein D3C87_1595250 [compost metagenome]
MGVEEDFQDFLQADLVGVVGQAHHFGVPGVALADLLVAGVDGLAVGVAAFHVGDATDSVKDGFGAPEAAAAQGDGLQVVGHEGLHAVK